MKKTKILYWTFTILFSLMMFGASIPDILIQPIAIKGMHDDLGYPIYLIPFVGIAKLLGVIAILIPGFPRIKEWAYAGLMIDIIGAFYSIVAVGSPVANWAFMFLPLALGILSYVFYHKKLSQQSTSEKSVPLNLQTV